MSAPADDHDRATIERALTSLRDLVNGAIDRGDHARARDAARRYEDLLDQTCLVAANAAPGDPAHEVYRSVVSEWADARRRVMARLGRSAWDEPKSVVEQTRATLKWLGEPPAGANERSFHFGAMSVIVRDHVSEGRASKAVRLTCQVCGVVNDVEFAPDEIIEGDFRCRCTERRFSIRPELETRDGHPASDVLAQLQGVTADVTAASQRISRLLGKGHAGSEETQARDAAELERLRSDGWLEQAAEEIVLAENDPRAALSDWRQSRKAELLALLRRHRDGGKRRTEKMWSWPE